jgi:hypothetical protein
MRRSNFRLSFFALPLCLLVWAIGFAQQADDALRLRELRRLRDQTALDPGLRSADALVVIHERALGDAARHLIGLEVVLSNGSTIRVTSIETELKTAAAMVKIGLQAKSTITVNLQLSGRIHSGETTSGALRLPIQVTEVKLGNGFFSSLLVKSMLGEWLNPQTWNDELPAIELPLEIAETVRIPAGKFEVGGELPMEISSPPVEWPLKLSLAALRVLDKRAVLALQLEPAAASAIQTSVAGPNHNDALALEREIESLAGELGATGDLRIRLSRRLLSRMLTEIAAAHKTDFTLRLKPGRVRAEEVNVFVNITNYTDVESGQGRADVSDLAIERIADGGLHVRLSGQGELDAQVKGREYGIPYRLSPHVTFVIADRPIPLQFSNQDGRMLLRAAPGATFPIELRIGANVAGRDLAIHRTVVVDASRWLDRIELPSFFGRELPVPRRVQLDANGAWSVTAQRKLSYTLANLRLAATDDALDLAADLKLAQP